MRQLLVTFVALLLTAPPAALAQRGQGGSRPTPPPAPTPPPTRTVPPPIVYPFGPLMTPPSGGLSSSTPFRTNGPRVFPSGSTAYAPWIFGYSEPSLDPASGRRSRSSGPEATGLLRLDVTPGAAQVFVDSYYVGTVDDVNAQRVLQLEAGTHRLEFRAPQYQTLTVDLRINPFETVTYRNALDLARPQAAPPRPAAAAATVMYVIPNCYLGNLPPRQNRLPAGCDVKQVQVIKPSAAAARQ